VLGRWALPFDRSKVQLEKRSGIRLFKDLNWNLTQAILEYLDYAVIMKKLRYLNHETLYVTSERADMIKAEKKILLRISLEAFIPMLTHPYVKFAEDVTLRIRDMKTYFYFHVYHILLEKQYFPNAKRLNLVFDNDYGIPVLEG
jgi:hypothetical protein